MRVGPEFFELQAGWQDDLFEVGIIIHQQPAQDFVPAQVEGALNPVVTKFQPMQLRAWWKYHMADC